MSPKQRFEATAPRAEQRQRARDRRTGARQLFGRAHIGTAHDAATDQLLTLEDVRVRLSLTSKWAVYRLIEHHGLPTRAVGGRYRVSLHELEAWTKQRG